MSMLRRRFMMLAAGSLFAVTAGVTRAEEPHKIAPPDAVPEAIVKLLYDIGDTVDAMTVKAERERYFTAATAKLMAKVLEKSKKNDEPGIDYEPLIDGQDGEVQNLVITKTEEAGDKATVTAAFDSFDEKVSVDFAFEREKGVWKIANISGRPRGGVKSDLLAVMKDYTK
jgi:hypothetical protein